MTLAIEPGAWLALDTTIGEVDIHSPVRFDQVRHLPDGRLEVSFWSAAPVNGSQVLKLTVRITFQNDRVIFGRTGRERRLVVLMPISRDWFDHRFPNPRSAPPFDSMGRFDPDMLPPRLESWEKALFLYGKWVRVRRRPGILEEGIPSTIGLTAAEILMGAGAEEVWGLIDREPVEAILFGEPDYEEVPSVAIIEKGRERVEWGEDGWTLYVQRSTHCWAEQLGDWTASLESLAFRRVELVVPHGEILHLLVPFTTRGDMTFLSPPFKEGEGFDFGARIASFATNRETAATIFLSEEIEPFPSVHDAATESFRAQLVDLFDALRADHIFGIDIYGGGWAPGEGFDAVVDRVPAELRKEWGWRSPADMSLCWSAVSLEEQRLREEAGRTGYNPTGWHQEYHRRVDEWLLPLPNPVNATKVFFDGPTSTDRQRIADAIVSRAPDAGLKANWDGDLKHSITISLS